MCVFCYYYIIILFGILCMSFCSKKTAFLSSLMKFNCCFPFFHCGTSVQCHLQTQELVAVRPLHFDDQRLRSGWFLLKSIITSYCLYWKLGCSPPYRQWCCSPSFWTRLFHPLNDATDNGVISIFNVLSWVETQS